MDSNSQPAGSSPPPKPWDRAGASSGPAPFKPPSAGSTSGVVEASGTANPGEIVSSSDRNAATNRNALGRPVPTRPWEQNYGTSNYVGGGGYGLTSNSGYGSGMNGSYGGVGGYGSGMYGNSMYNRGGYGGLYGSSMGGYGSSMGGYGSSMGGYGSSMGAYGSSMGAYGSSMGGYGMGMGGPYGAQDPNNPYGPPSSPPGFWMSFLRVMQGVVNFFGRISILIDQNTQAFHMFMTALLQLFDRSGMLYGELARFVLRILGVKTKSLQGQAPPFGPDGLPIPGFHKPPTNQNLIEGPKAGPNGSWDNVWVNDSDK